ncbi:hypothetical protein [Streptomyces sp. NPDC101150]|uniref:hypothetical protein n=1 Tax=Streptomyces sp. NPDC101150 TaxID=3366114 RepID=UPI00381C85CC
MLRHGMALSGLLAACLVVPAGPGAAGTAHACVTRSAAETSTGRGDATVSMAPAAAVQRDFQKRPSVHPAQKLMASSVGVVWNVFYDEKNPSDGNITDAAIAKQLNVVNHAFSPIGLSFNLQQVNRHGVPRSVLHGVAPGSQDEARIKQSHQGNQQILNIFSVHTDDTRGWSTYPWD